VVLTGLLGASSWNVMGFGCGVSTAALGLTAGLVTVGSTSKGESSSTKPCANGVNNSNKQSKLAFMAILS
jgi:hypothetical protein